MAAQSKILLIAKLDAARDGLLVHGAQLRQDLDVPMHVRSAFENHKGAWIGGAAVLGWVIARLPGRSKKKSADDSHQHNGYHPDAGTQATAKKYAIGGILLAILRVALNALKPTLTAVATRKLRDLAAQRIRW